MHIILNGQPIDVDARTTIRSLIEQRGLTPDRVAIEVNKRLVRSAQYDRELKDDDQVEIVTFVGGG